MPNLSIHHRPITVLLLALMLSAVGCQPEPWPLPEVYPVTGKVVVSDNIKIEGATVQFAPLNSPAEYAAKGSVTPDGKFKLRMSHRRGMIDGAPKGEYAVTVFMPIGGGDPREIAERFTVEPRENHFVIKLPGAH